MKQNLLTSFQYIVILHFLYFTLPFLVPLLLYLSKNIYFNGQTSCGGKFIYFYCYSKYCCYTSCADRNQHISKDMCE